MRNGPAALLLALSACAPPPPPPTPAPLQPTAPTVAPQEAAATPPPAQPAPTPAQPPNPAPPAPMPGFDTVRAGEFDNGKMWTFDAPPASYLAETYGFSPGDDWYAKARLGALRIPNCSASLVSPTGLVMTNHHCARDFVTQVAEEGENLLDEGFYAATLADERTVTDFDADQLIDIVDVTQEIRAVVDAAADAEARSAVRDSVTEAVAERIEEERGGEDAGIEVEVISLYNGGLYSAYVFRRYSRAALVMAPELGLGFFGGEPDNFTYPRWTSPSSASWTKMAGRSPPPTTSTGRVRASRKGISSSWSGTRAAPRGCRPLPNWSSAATWRCLRCSPFSSRGSSCSRATSKSVRTSPESTMCATGCSVSRTRRRRSPGCWEVCATRM